MADSENSAALVRNILELSDSPDAAARVQMAPPGSTLEKLFASGTGAVVVVAHASQIMKDKSYEQFAKRGGFTLNPIDAAKALARKYPALSEETLTTGMLSGAPGDPRRRSHHPRLEWLLVAQSRLSTTTMSDLARLIYENKADLALSDGFASRSNRR